MTTAKKKQRTNSLTTHQRKLLAEVKEIASLTSMDHWNIGEYTPESRTIYLLLMRQRLIRGEVILKYALVDEYLCAIICNYYFKRKRGETSFKKLWRTKKFERFNYFILDDLYLMAKLRLVDAIEELPKGMYGTIAAINDVRNALAHSFFPENRRQYRPKGALTYKKVPLYSLDGVRQFLADISEVSEYMRKRAFG